MKQNPDCACLGREWRVVGGERKLRRQIVMYISGSFYSNKGDKDSGIATDTDTDERNSAPDFPSSDR